MIDFALAAAAVAFALWFLYFVFGPQGLGLPAMIGVLVVFGVAKALTSAGPLVVVAMVLGLVLLFIVIGMAMTLGAGRPPQAHDEKPREEQPPAPPAAAPSARE